MSAPWPQVRILGSTVHLPTRAQVQARVSAWLDEPDGRCHQIVVTGFHGLWEASRRPDVHDALAAADLWIPDGIAPVWIARLRGHECAERYPGAELMADMLDAGRARGTRHYFYGDTDETLAALREAVERRWPGNHVVGTFSPPFAARTDADKRADVERINAARPDVLWVALGLPRQDQWIHANRDDLRVPLAVGVGAAFAFVAGTVERAPAWMGRAGLEWLYRLWKEPRKCWRRVFVDGPRFVAAVFHEQARLRRQKS